MKKSEKILLALVAVAGIYGLAEYLLKSSLTVHNSSDAHITSTPELKILKSEVDVIASYESTSLASLSEEINKPWPDDIFLYEKGNEEKTATPQEPSDNNDQLEQLKSQVQTMSYSGFLTMGNSSIAIINGLDYRKNDTLSGFTITNITPEKVELFRDGLDFTISAKNETRTGLFSVPQISKEATGTTNDLHSNSNK